MNSIDTQAMTNNTNGVRRPDETFRALLRTMGLLKRVMEPYFAQFGISGAQWGVLRVLYRAEVDGLGGLRLNKLSQQLLIRPPSVTGVVHRLEQAGMVLRTVSTEDLRVKQVALTPEGRALVERVLSAHEAQITSVLSGLEVREQQALHGILAKLQRHLEQMAAQGGPEPAGQNMAPDRSG